MTIQTSDSNSKTFDVLRGVTKLAIPISPGDTMKGSIERNGQKLVDVTAPGFTFQERPDAFNYNYFVTGAGSGATSRTSSSSIPPKPSATAKS